MALVRLRPQVACPILPKGVSLTPVLLLPVLVMQMWLQKCKSLPVLPQSLLSCLLYLREGELNKLTKVPLC